jgi:lysophospholipase L1-like esterase
MRILFRLACLAVAATVLSTVTPARSEGWPLPAGVKRVVFLGDSITYGGRYIDYVEAYFLTRFPDRHVELLNLGLPSETVSGLSEPGHAGGDFPRPDLHERLTRVLERTKPDMVIACYGMNDGIYQPLSEDRFARYRAGTLRLVDRVKAVGIPLILLTPPVFDMPTDPYHEVLAHYAAWLMDQRKVGWRVFDVQSPMEQHLVARRVQTPDYFLAKDHIHPNPFGHWLIAQSLLAGLGAPANVDEAVIEFDSRKVLRGRITDLADDQRGIRFHWLSRRPMPFDPQWDEKSAAQERIAERFNRHRLVVRGVPADQYRLYEDTVLLGTVTRQELKAGVDLLRFSKLTTNQQGGDMLKLIRRRQSMLTDAWLESVGHKRPRMAKGLPLEEATRQANELEAHLRKMTSPVELHLRLVP